MDFEALGTTPVAQDNPAGEDARYEPEFEELETEIGKLNSPTASSGVEWDKVIELSSKILAEKSKNLLVACYLSIGLMKRDDLEGLAEGVHVIRTMLDTFWDSLYPPKKRMRGRLNAVEWWMEKIDAELEGHDTVTWLKDKRDNLSLIHI